MIADTAHGPASYLWVDLETTGLTAEHDLLELSAIVTDRELVEIDAYTTLVRPQVVTFEQLYDNPVVEGIHQRSGLLADIYAYGAASPTQFDVEDHLIRMIRRLSSDGGRPLKIAGGGVSHFDFPYLKERMPRLTGMLHYRPLDITQVSQAYTDATGSALFGEKQNKAHRAEADIREDLGRARAFWRMFREMERLNDDRARPKLSGRESVLAGVEIIRAYETAATHEDSSERDLRALIEGTREGDALAGVTAIAAHLAGVVAGSTELTFDNVLQNARRALTGKRAQGVGTPRM